MRKKIRCSSTLLFGITVPIDDSGKGELAILLDGIISGGESQSGSRPLPYLPLAPEEQEYSTPKPIFFLSSPVRRRLELCLFRFIGFSTKIHLATDALGNAWRFILTGGERHDIMQTERLIENFAAHYVIADKDYDAEAFVSKPKERNSAVVIPSRTNCKEQREIDAQLYKERHLIENQMGKLKQSRRVFSRFDKLAKNYLSFIYLTSTVVWLR